MTKDYLSQAHDLAKELDDLIYPGMFMITVYFKGDKGYVNNEEMTNLEAVDKATSSVIHRAIQCSCFANGSWLSQVRYSQDLEAIKSQKEEDYCFDMEILNFITTLKVFANEAQKNPTKVYFAEYDSDTELYWTAIDEEIEEQLGNFQDNE